MKEVKPGDVILVKMKVERVIVTQNETVYNCAPASFHSGGDTYLGYITEEDIVDVIKDD